MKIPEVKSKDLLSVTDLTRQEILDIFDFTAKMKKENKKGKWHNHLNNKILAMIFDKSSTRTRVSFESGMLQLGGHAIFLSGNDIQLGRGETAADTARVLSRYVKGIMIRTFSQESVEELARDADIPVINGLTDTYHPCQSLTDFFTVQEYSGAGKKVKITYVGDGNNVAHSLMLTSAILGHDITVACPQGYCPEDDIIEKARDIAKNNKCLVVVTDDLKKGVEGAHYLYTDVWTSMGQEKETEKRKKALVNYKITHDLLSYAAPGCKVMHCLPAHRGEEIDADVMESEHSIIFDQAENRLHVQKAILCALLGKGNPPGKGSGGAK